VLIACEFSGIVRDAFIALGHDAWSCDLLPTERPGPHFQCDIREVLNRPWDLVICHPPCTYLTCAGNKWFGPKYHDRFPDRLQQMQDAAAFFMLFTNLSATYVAIENPIGRMSSLWRKPDQIIQPWQFGHDARKATCLWLTGLPLLHPTEIVTPAIVRTKGGNTMSKWQVDCGHNDRKNRAHERSRTFPGIATAMAEQWGKLRA
jgi:hypothetical protein